MSLYFDDWSDLSDEPLAADQSGAHALRLQSDIHELCSTPESQKIIAEQQLAVKVLQPISQATEFFLKLFHQVDLANADEFQKVVLNNRITLFCSIIEEAAAQHSHRSCLALSQFSKCLGQIGREMLSQEHIFSNQIKEFERVLINFAGTVMSAEKNASLEDVDTGILDSLNIIHLTAQELLDLSILTAVNRFPETVRTTIEQYQDLTNSTIRKNLREYKLDLMSQGGSFSFNDALNEKDIWLDLQSRR